MKTWTIVVFLVVVNSPVYGNQETQREQGVLNEEELPMLLPQGAESSSALQSLSDRGYRVREPVVRDLVLYETDANGERQRREWLQKRIAVCSFTWRDGFVEGTNVIYVIINDDMHVEEAISRTTFTGP